MARANQGGQPIRWISGAISHQISRPVLTTVPMVAITTTAPNGRNAIGAMVIPANGG